MPTTTDLIDPHDDAELAEWYRVWRAGSEAGRSAPLSTSLVSIGYSLRNPAMRNRHIALAARDGGAIVGAALLILPLRENRDMADWSIAVEPHNRGHGYGTALLRHGMTLCEQDGRVNHVAEVDVPDDVPVDEHPGVRFARRHGFVAKHQEDHLVLRLPVPAERLVALRSAAATHHPGYSFASWAGACPTEFETALAELFTVMDRDVPTGELVIEPTVWDVEMLRTAQERVMDRQMLPLITVVRGPDGDFVGYSRMYVSYPDRANVIQDDTLVVSTHRGHRLGYELKARNLDLLADQDPEAAFVHTWNAGDNAAMQRVNERFGFTVAERMHEFQRIDR